MKVFLYLRVSSEEQARHGYSLDARHEALTDFCKKNNHVILGEYRDEGISARKPYTKRPAMLELLHDIETIKPDMILFTKLDRWFRNIKEYYKVQDILDRNKVDWKAIHEEYDTSTASGRLYVNIKLSIAQDEADRTSERIKDIQGQKIAQGLWLGGRTPFGYTLSKDNHLIFDDNIHIMREAIDYYLMHHALKTTVRHINETHGTNFTYQRMQWAFKQPTLKGEYRGNPNFCEPLVTPEEFDRLQDLMKKNIKYNTKRTYLFTGLLKCPHCGRNLSGVANEFLAFRSDGDSSVGTDEDRNSGLGF
jgi:DNA invertase Pin-like site-specific DNA recombinase